MARLSAGDGGGDGSAGTGDAGGGGDSGGRTQRVRNAVEEFSRRIRDMRRPAGQATSGNLIEGEEEDLERSDAGGGAAGGGTSDRERLEAAAAGRETGGAPQDDGGAVERAGRAGDGALRDQGPQEGGAVRREEPGRPDEARLTGGQGDDARRATPDEAEATARAQRVLESTRDEQDRTPTDVAREQDVGGTVQQREDLVQQVLDQLPPGFTAADVVLSREGDTIRATVSQEALARERGEFEEGVSRLRAFSPADRSLTRSERQAAFQENVSRLQRANRQDRSLNRSERQADFLQAVRSLDPGEGATPPIAEVRASIVRQLEQQLGVDLDETDVNFRRENGQLVGEPTDEARESAFVESSPVVQALGGTALGGAARAAAGGAFQFRQFGRRQREQVVQPAFDEFRRLTGLEDEIAAFEEFGATQEDRLNRELAQVEQFLAAQSPTDLAAAAAPVAVAEPTPGGEIALGALLAAGAGAAALERASPEERAVLGLGASIASDPGRAAQQALTGRQGDAVARAEVPGLFPPEQQIPERRELFRSELPIEEPNVFLPELQPPTAPASQFSAGRFTPPEVAIEADVGEVPGGPPVTDVPVNTDEPGGGFAGPELPTPTITASPVQRAIQRGDQVERAERRRRRRGTRRVPQEFIPDEPVTIGGGVGEGVGEAGEGSTQPGGGFRVIFRRGRTRSMDPRIIETPFGRIDVTGIDPALARVLEEQELGESAQADAVGVEGAAQAAEEAVGIFGFRQAEDELVAEATAEAEATALDQDQLLDERLAQAVAQEVTQEQAQDTAQRTATDQATATTTVETTDTAEPVEPFEETLVEEPFENVFETGIGQARSPLDFEIPFESERDDIPLEQPTDIAEELFASGIADVEDLERGLLEGFDDAEEDLIMEDFDDVERELLENLGGRGDDPLAAFEDIERDLAGELDSFEAIERELLGE